MSGRPEAGWRRYLRFWGQDVRADVDEELRHHLELCTEELLSQGLSPEAARAEALRRFGDVEGVRRACEAESQARAKAEHRADLFESLWQDVRYALRSLRRTPGFVVATVLTLALGIAANTSVFSVVEGVLLRPPPFPEPERLVALFTRFPGLGVGRANVSRPELEDFRQARDTFAHIAAYDPDPFNVAGAEGEPTRVNGLRVEAEWFDVLGISAGQGRLFRDGEDAAGQDGVVVLTHGFWKRQFGAGRDAIGRTLLVDGVARTVIGVLPEDFEFGTADLLVPLVLGPVDNARRSSHNLKCLTRLAPGVSLEQAQARMSGLTRQLAEAYPKNYPSAMGFNAELVPLHDTWVEDIRGALLLLLGAVVLVQLIACANVANLLLARGEARQHELAVRTALGASRGRLVRQLLTESLVLGVGGGLLGLLLASWGVDLLLLAAGDSVPRAEHVQVDLSALGVALGLAVVSGVVFGLVPALQASRGAPQAVLQSGGRGFTSGAGRLRARNVLVVAEVALAVTLVTCAGLLLRSFWELRQVEPGFDGERVLSMDVTLPPAQYDSGPKVARFYRELLERLRGLPGVEVAAATSGVPMSGHRSNWDVEVEGRPVGPGESNPSPFYHAVTPDYFRALGTRVTRGRSFTAEDDGSRLEVALVNESGARMLWPGEEPLGKRFRFAGGPSENPFPWVTVVGVVADVRSTSLKEGARPEYYLLHGPLAESRDISHLSMTVVLRTKLEPLSLAPSAQRLVHELDSGLAVANVRTLEQVAMSSVSRTRFTALLLALFGLAGLVLAAVGIYGVLAFAVAQRTREMGIRMALGAQRVDVLRLVVGQGLRLTAVGLVPGAVAALAAGRLLHGLLYGISAADPLTFLMVVAVLGTVALLASYLPARRATSVEPVTALRSE